MYVFELWFFSLSISLYLFFLSVCWDCAIKSEPKCRMLFPNNRIYSEVLHFWLCNYDLWIEMLICSLPVFMMHTQQTKKGNVFKQKVIGISCVAFENILNAYTRVVHTFWYFSFATFAIGSMFGMYFVCVCHSTAFSLVFGKRNEQAILSDTLSLKKKISMRMEFF